MKKILISLLVVFLPILIYGQKKVILKDDGSHEVIECKKEITPLDTFLIDENVTEEQLEIFLQSRKDTSYYEDECECSKKRGKIIPTSWYISTRVEKNRVYLFLEEGTLYSEVVENEFVKEEPHKPLTILFYLIIAYLSIMTLLPYFKKSLDSKFEDFSKSLLWCLLAPIVIFLMGWSVSFHLGIILFFIAMNIGFMIIIGIETDFRGMGALATILSGLVAAVFASIYSYFFMFAIVLTLCLCICTSYIFLEE